MKSLKRIKKQHRLLAVILLIGLIIATLIAVLFSKDTDSCTSVENVDAQIIVRTVPGRVYYGLNTDTENLTFGSVSPGTEVKRSIVVQHSKDAFVSVYMVGDITTWTIIEPHQFFLTPQAEQQVFFTVLVPGWAKPGNYVGRVEFCFRE